MSTSTILRVKRRLEENPQDALVLLCKRLKTDSEEISPSLFVFRGTVDNQEHILVKDLVPKEDLKQKSISNVTDIIQKMRKERKDVSTENRYEVVNCRRGLKEDSGSTEDLFDLVDLARAEDDLSSDTGEDKIYDDPPDLFNEDVKNFGSAYAKYKARVMTEENGLPENRSLIHCSRIKDLDEESIEGYKEDSDDGFYYGQEQDSEQFKEQYGDESSDEYSPD
ncbi:putative RNA polymerase II nuclear localization protein SLC7A6OS [Papilio machaon]|uniref:Putative RNA polymerase II nuclear localization protein SLC7A6OS n=1 Tax=Papilio machaon TaxID=76193 RepID=A0A194R5Y1_PAPMA|nr:putative RNA polymerase II nuclear localization protein SLC7A6OS [Papilio machaon]